MSLNPAIDRRLWLDRIVLGEVNRIRRMRSFPGGKAAHVAMAAHALGEEAIWIGFLGGQTGDQCELGLNELHIPVRRISTRSETRTNLEIIEHNDRITEILEPGGEISGMELEEMLAVCGELFSQYFSSAVVALSGSLPPGVPTDAYARLIALARQNNCRVLLDTSGEPLRQALASQPDLIKPNAAEAEKLCGSSLSSPDAAIELTRQMIALGPQSVALSLGADGLLWRRDQDAPLLRSTSPPVKVVSTVGCGDAALAGFAFSLARNLSPAETIRMATACGTANCLAETPGAIDVEVVNRLLPLVKVSELASV